MRAYRGAGPIGAEDVGSRGRVTVPGSDAVSNLLPEGRNPLQTETRAGVLNSLLSFAQWANKARENPAESRVGTGSKEHAWPFLDITFSLRPHNQQGS